MYNLDEQLMTKTEKQITMLIKNRLDKIAQSYEVTYRFNSHWRFAEDNKEIAVNIKAQKTINDCMEWIKAAIVCFSAEMWDRMICSTGYTIDEYGYKSLLD